MLLQYRFVICYSAYKYDISNVTWQTRNDIICIKYNCLTINWQKSRKKAIQIENNQLHCCFLYFSHECCCIFSSGHSFLFLYLKILQRNSKQWVAKHHTNLAIVLVDYQPHLQGGKLPVRYAIRHPCSAIITLTELNYLFTIVHYRTFNSPRDWIRIISRDFLTRWVRWM